VLKNLDFTLKKSESLGIVGESGSGKSVTALALMGLLPQNARVISGKAFLSTEQYKNPIDLIAISDKHHRLFRGKKIAMVFQEPMTSLNPSMRCGRQVVEAINLHQNLFGNEAEKACLKLFAEMQLPDPEKTFSSYPHEMSGGQKQRVMIAMALAGNPNLLIADEPTTALDVTVQKEILLLLKLLIAERGMSLIFISHDLGVMSLIADRLIVLKDGEKVEDGETQQLFTNPNHPYTQGLISCRPPIDFRPLKLHTVQDFVEGKASFGVAPTTISSEDWAQRNDEIYKKSPLLNVENVVVEYVLKRNLLGNTTKSFTAVSNISFKLYPGETLGLVGESGCGKTSLGRSILGLTETKSGTISYKGKVVGKMNPKEERKYRKEVQIIFQDPYSSLNPRHTIGEAIMEPLKVHGLIKGEQHRKNRVMELLEQVSLPSDSFFRYPHEFSGGQRQRIAIARALALEPEVIVCDEMVSALDVSVQAQILNLLNRLKAEFGLTYIFISHDLSVVKYMSSRVLVMKSGEMIEYGDSDLVFANPASDYTQKLIDSIPR
jgi:peptide/nickel transport system ATP-binding protein